MIRSSRSGKINCLFNLLSHQPDIDKIYLHAKDPYEAKDQFLTKTKVSTILQHLDESKAFLEYTNNMDDIYENIGEYNPNKKRKIFIVFNNIIAGMLSNKKVNPQ